MVDRKRFQGDNQFRPSQVADQSVAPTAMANLFQGINNDVSARLDELTRIESIKAGSKAGAGQTNIDLKKGNTIAAQNFNAAALQAMSSEVKTRLVDSVEQVVRDHPVDIDGAGEKFNAIQTALTKETNPDLLGFATEEFNALAGRAKRKILDNAFLKAREEQKADIELGVFTSKEQAKEAAFQGDVERTEQLLDEGNEQIRSLAIQGFIPASEAQRRVQELNKELEVDSIFGTFVRQSGSNEVTAEAAMQEFIQDPPKNLDAKQFQSAAAQMNQHISRLKTDNGVKKSEFTRQVNDAMFVMSRGVLPDNIDQLIVETSQFPELQQKLIFGQRNAQVMGAFADIGLEQQDFFLNNLRSNQSTNREDIELLEKLETMHKETISLLKDDPVALMAKTGREINPFNIEDQASMIDRRALADEITTKYNIDAHGLTKSEIAGLSERIDVAPPGAQIEIIQTLQENFGDEQTAVILEDLGRDQPEFTVAAGLSNKRPSVASDILAGQQMLKENPASSPTPTDIAIAADEKLGKVFVGQQRANIIKAATALTAARQFREKGALSKELFDAEEWKNSVDLITNQFVDFNDTSIPAPTFEMSQGQFENFFDELGNGALHQRGFIPMAGRTRVTMDMVRENGKLVPVGDGIYLIDINGFVMTPDGEPFEWNLGDIVDNGLRLPELKGTRRQGNRIDAN